MSVKNLVLFDLEWKRICSQTSSEVCACSFRYVLIYIVKVIGTLKLPFFSFLPLISWGQGSLWLFFWIYMYLKDYKSAKKKNKPNFGVPSFDPLLLTYMTAQLQVDCLSHSRKQVYHLLWGSEGLEALICLLLGVWLYLCSTGSPCSIGWHCQQQKMAWKSLCLL